MRGRSVFVLPALVLTFIFLTNCRGDNHSGLIQSSITTSGTTTSTLGTQTIHTSVQGAHVASQIFQTRELLLNSTQLQKNIADLALPLMSPALLGQNTDIICRDGGAFQYSGTYASGIYNLTFTFNGCRDKGYQYVGGFTLNGIPSDFTINLGSPAAFNIFNFNPTYTVLLAYLKANLGFTIIGTGDLNNAVYTIKSNGTIVTFDYFLLDTFTMTFANLKSNYTLATDNVTKDQTISITSDGQFREAWGTSTLLSMKFTGFNIEKVHRFDASSASFYADEASLNGLVSFLVRPSSFGVPGDFQVATQAPIKTVYAAPRHTTQGTVLVNTNDNIVYAAGGDLDVTVTNDTPLHYTNEYNLMRLTDFAAMEQDKPPLLAPPAPGAPLSLPTGSTMAVTLTWTGPAPSFVSTSDMDLHVKYYSTLTPAPADVETWHIDWHQGKTYPGAAGACTDPPGISFGDAFDLEGDHTGICDIGLDFDDTNGFGPEHITALKIPAGYYVVSVNSYSLNALESPTTLYLSLHIGDVIIGPYTGTVSSSDGEGTTPAAWVRVADVRVNADGSVTILAPDTAITPWH